MGAKFDMLPSVEAAASLAGNGAVPPAEITLAADLPNARSTNKPWNYELSVGAVRLDFIIESPNSISVAYHGDKPFAKVAPYELASEIRGRAAAAWLTEARAPMCVVESPYKSSELGRAEISPALREMARYNGGEID